METKQYMSYYDHFFLQTIMNKFVKETSITPLTMKNIHNILSKYRGMEGFHLYDYYLWYTPQYNNVSTETNVPNMNENNVSLDKELPTKRENEEADEYDTYSTDSYEPPVSKKDLDYDLDIMKKRREVYFGLKTYFEGWKKTTHTVNTQENDHGFENLSFLDLV